MNGGAVERNTVPEPLSTYRNKVLTESTQSKYKALSWSTWQHLNKEPFIWNTTNITADFLFLLNLYDNNLAGSCHVDGGAVGGCSHVVAVFHQIYFEVLRLQVVDEIRNIRACWHNNKNNTSNQCARKQLM